LRSFGLSQSPWKKREGLKGGGGGAEGDEPVSVESPCTAVLTSSREKGRRKIIRGRRKKKGGTFDCYGTLIDFNLGSAASMKESAGRKGGKRKGRRNGKKSSSA